MKKFIVALLLAALAVGLAVGGAAARSAKSTAATADICVLLPDPKSSVRWETQDRPALVAAFKKAKVTYVINNADGDAQKQRSQADQCLANGAKVVILVSLDAGSSLAIEKAAVAKSAKVIEYDRQVGKGSPASIYISFDGKAVGVLQGKGVVAGLKANGKYGSEAGRRRAERRRDRQQLVPVQGRVRLDPQAALSRTARSRRAPISSCPAGTTRRRGRSSSRCSSRPGNKIDAVAAANDGLANAVVTALKAKKLEPIPLSGQDATAQGVQNIISGWQSMTVWKDTRILATAVGRGGDRPLEGPEAEADGHGAERLEEAAGVHHPAGLDHEGELQAALQRLPEEERGLPRGVQRSSASRHGTTSRAPRAGALDRHRR